MIIHNGFIDGQLGHFKFDRVFLLRAPYLYVRWEKHTIEFPVSVVPHVSGDSPVIVIQWPLLTMSNTWFCRIGNSPIIRSEDGFWGQDVAANFLIFRDFSPFVAAEGSLSTPGASRELRRFQPVVTENAVRAENAEVPILREILVLSR